jgi:hypothetical protein
MLQQASPPLRSVPPSFLSWLSFAAAAALSLYATFDFVSLQWFRDRALRSPGRIVDFRNIGPTTCAVHAVVRFDAVGGRPKEFLDRGCYAFKPFLGHPSSYELPVEVLYDPSEPSNARIDSFRSTVGNTVTQASAALFFASVGTTVLLRRRVLNRLRAGEGDRWRGTAQPAWAAWVVISAILMLFFMCWPVSWLFGVYP